ncbi:hypothetical protein [Hymenobacter convexus]|uniref:hypothetical protein n=1 Tax=Hymenobacter sp. CA1UV-4 TaxID=3063782 RepID=UPI0027133387|nr:hypothetical protein [Hymenobacter sp. CA1UV-4]MDO7851159.1 hypothetical protein [Hymenobacter sp. CA1UV-4]
MAVSEAALKENYRRLSDEKLMRIAAEDAPRLRPEALVLLKAELSTRGLAETAEKTIQAQLRQATEAEVLAYGALLQAQPCPVCGSAARPLNATVTHRVLSFVVMTTWKKQLVIACPPCLDQLNHDAMKSSALLGWWGFPWGVPRTIDALLSNQKMTRANHAPYPNETLLAFVAGNVGRIEAARANARDLHALLKATLRS